jgi:transposase
MPPHRGTIVLDDGHGGASRVRHRGGTAPPPDACAAAGVPGIVFGLKTGITRNQLPAEVVGCSGVTCWRRVRDWTEAGVWAALHELRSPIYAPPANSTWIGARSTPRTCTRPRPANSSAASNTIRACCTCPAGACDEPGQRAKTCRITGTQHQRRSNRHVPLSLTLTAKSLQARNTSGTPAGC